MKNLYVDIGLPADKVRSLVEIGDMVTMARTCERVGETVVSKTLDNRVSVFVMIEALREIKSHQCEILAVATTQEEVEVARAATAAYALEPDVGIALDGTLANDFPGPRITTMLPALDRGRQSRLWTVR